MFLAAAVDKPFRRARAQGGVLAVLRRIGVVASWAYKAVAKLVGSTDHYLIQFICHLTIACLIKHQYAYLCIATLPICAYLCLGALPNYA